MKLLTFLFSVTIVFTCCKKNGNTSTPIPTYEVMQHPGWTAEPFKVANTNPATTEYTIQFPAGYSGGINIGFEGNTFHKYIPGTPTLPVSIRYYFCNSTQCYPFWDTLSNTSQASVHTYINGSPDIFLDHRVEFTANGNLAGILYHNNLSPVTGVLYWKDNGYFKNIAGFQGELARLNDIIEILRTIKKL